MTEQSKFAGALGRLNKQPATLTGPRTPSEATAQRRPVGKRSDPEFSPTTFFVRKKTKRKVTQLLLEEENGGKDLSDLVEELLATWLSEHSQT